MTPLLVLSISCDFIQGILSGVARGCGLQHLPMFINLGTFYLIGMPIAGVLAFKFNLHAKGLWIGLICSLFVQMLGLLWEQAFRPYSDRCGILSSFESVVSWFTNDASCSGGRRPDLAFPMWRFRFDMTGSVLPIRVGSNELFWASTAFWVWEKYCEGLRKMVGMMVSGWFGRKKKTKNLFVKLGDENFWCGL
ncbi:mate efflux family protein lal5 [Phtheirospermum japonicum]|uniref:Mate efflux family protein lal5 n=1 Tax=Phtheirospermum japonicum TaxID=374723 RepID=A0A830C9S5_9LAMI|nr:mate efflux family protein lal5 [Phtheirospermum japonicum]